jgi:hypothetical protein
MTTLHLVGTIQKNIGFAPDHPPRQETDSAAALRSPAMTRGRHRYRDSNPGFRTENPAS